MSSQDRDEEAIEAAFNKLVQSAGTALVIVLLLGVLWFGATFQVNDGERGVVTRFGEVQHVAGPGLNFKIPFVDDVHYYEVRTKAYTMSSSAGEGDKANRDDSIEALTQEGLNVNVDMTTRYHIDPAKVDYMYESVGATERDVLERIVRPTAREAVRSCSAQYPVEGIYSDQRDDFAQCVKDNVNEDFVAKGLVLETVQIRNIMLPDKVRTAIQNKQAAQEKIEQKQKELQIEELETERKIIEAQGIAESNQIIADSLTPQYLTWYWIQEGLEKGDAMYVPVGDNGMPMFKDVDKTGQDDESNESNSSPDYTTTRTRNSTTTTSNASA